MGSKRAVVIGAGLGGLSAAIHLRLHGWNVDVVEQGVRAGGKCNRISWEGHHFDTGPSLLTLPFILENLFREAGHALSDFLTLRRLDPAVHYYFPDGWEWEAPGTLAGWEAAIARDFPGDLAGWKRFTRRNERLWKVSFPVFLQAPMDWMTPLRVPYGKALRALPDLWPQSMTSVLKKDFRDPRLLQIFQRYATYNGSDPDRTPATFNVISYAEAAYGSWHVEGGIYEVVKAMVALGEKLGVCLHLGREVNALKFDASGKQVRAVHFADGENWKAEGVVVNMDAVSALAGPLFEGHPKGKRWGSRLRRGETSVSGTVLLLAVDRQVAGLGCHNLFFNADYRREFCEIFEEATPLSDPTLYLHIPAKVDASLAPPGMESWFLLVNAPPLDRHWEWSDEYADHLLTLLESRLKRAGIAFSRDWVRWKRLHTPHFFQREYQAWQGSLYGLSSNGMKQAYFRVPNHGPLRNLAFAGGSAHPGGGIPLVLTSGQLAAQALGRGSFEN